MNVGLRLAVVIGFIAICCGSLAIANRTPEQTLPTPYSSDDIQYFAPRSSRRLADEATAMKAYQAKLAAYEAAHPSKPVEPSSAYFIGENIQYFPPGPEFKLQREAAAMKAYKSDLEAQQAGRDQAP